LWFKSMVRKLQVSRLLGIQKGMREYRRVCPLRIDYLIRKSLGGDTLVRKAYPLLYSKRIGRGKGEKGNRYIFLRRQGKGGRGGLVDVKKD